MFHRDIRHQLFILATGLNIYERVYFYVADFCIYIFFSFPFYFCESLRSSAAIQYEMALGKTPTVCSAVLGPSAPQAVKVPVPRVRCSASVKNFFHAPLKTHFTSEVAHFDVPEMEPQIWPRSYSKLRRSKSVVFSGYLDSPSPPR